MSDKVGIKPKIGVVVPPAEMFCRNRLQDGEKRCVIGWMHDLNIRGLAARMYVYYAKFGTHLVSDNDTGAVPGPEILRRLIALSDDLIEIPAVGPTNE